LLGSMSITLRVMKQTVHRPGPGPAAVPTTGKNSIGRPGDSVPAGDARVFEAQAGDPISNFKSGNLTKGLAEFKAVSFSKVEKEPPSVSSPPVTADVLTALAIVGAGLSKYGGMIITGTLAFIGVIEPVARFSRWVHSVWQAKKSARDSHERVRDAYEEAVKFESRPVRVEMNDQQAPVFTGNSALDRDITKVVGDLVKHVRRTGRLDETVVVSGGRGLLTGPVRNIAAELKLQVVTVECSALKSLSAPELSDFMERLCKDIERGRASSSRSSPRDVKAVIYFSGFDELEEANRALARDLSEQIQDPDTLAKSGLVVVGVNEPTAQLLFENRFQIGVPTPLERDHLQELIETRIPWLSKDVLETHHIAEVLGAKLAESGEFEALELLEANNQRGRAPADWELSHLLDACFGPSDPKLPDCLFNVHFTLSALESLIAHEIGVPVLGFSACQRSAGGLVYRATLREGDLKATDMEMVVKELVLWEVRREYLSSISGEHNVRLPLTTSTGVIEGLHARLEKILSLNPQHGNLALRSVNNDIATEELLAKIQGQVQDLSQKILRIFENSVLEGGWRTSSGRNTKEIIGAAFQKLCAERFLECAEVRRHISECFGDLGLSLQPARSQVSRRAA